MLGLLSTLYLCICVFVYLRICVFVYFTFDTREYHIFDACRVISHKKNTPKHKIPPPFWKTPLIFDKPFPGPKKVTDMTQKKKPSFVIPIKNIFCKKNGPKRLFVASAVVRPFYPSLYGVTATN